MKRKKDINVTQITNAIYLKHYRSQIRQNKIKEM